MIWLIKILRIILDKDNKNLVDSHNKYKSPSCHQIHVNQQLKSKSERFICECVFYEYIKYTSYKLQKMIRLIVGLSPESRMMKKWLTESGYK